MLYTFINRMLLAPSGGLGTLHHLDCLTKSVLDLFIFYLKPPLGINLLPHCYRTIQDHVLKMNIIKTRKGGSCYFAPSRVRTIDNIKGNLVSDKMYV